MGEGVGEFLVREERFEDGAEGVIGGERSGGAEEVDVELGVGEGGGEIEGEFAGELGLADAASAGETGDEDAVLEGGFEGGEFGLAAGEVVYGGRDVGGAESGWGFVDDGVADLNVSADITTNFNLSNCNAFSFSMDVIGC